MSVPMQPSIRVAVVSEDRMLREVLEASLAGREDLQVVASGPEGDGGVDVLLVDAEFHPSSALAHTWEARERWPEAKVIAVGLAREDEKIVDFIEAGAGGYVLEGSTPEDLVAAIRAAQQGLAPCSPRVVASVLARISELSRRGEPVAAAAEVEPLTLREREILALLANGLGNKDIGRGLHITVQTVKNHVHRILEKLRVHRRRDAVRLAYDLGILAEPREIPPAGRSTPAAEEGESEGLNRF
jgi:two-component system nitrate/nitrite response regulator NarL